VFSSSIPRKELTTEEHSSLDIASFIFLKLIKHSADISMLEIELFVPVMHRVRKPLAFFERKAFLDVQRGPYNRTHTGK
jgi:hypothetical protein